jgi:hypothetical protein
MSRSAGHWKGSRFESQNFRREAKRALNVIASNVAYSDPDYQFEPCQPSEITQQGLLTIAALRPKITSLPSFSFRWDAKDDHLNVDIHGVSKSDAKLFENGEQGYVGHEPRRVADKVFMADIRTPKRRISTGNIGFSLQEVIVANEHIGTTDKASHEVALYPNPLPNVKTDAMADGKSSGLPSRSKVKRPTAEAGLGLSWNLENPRAVAWMKAHGAELVKGIDQTTRLQIRSILTQGMEEGWSYTRTADAIADQFPEFRLGTPGFKHIRNKAELISTTEAHIAYGVANWQAAQKLVEMGVQLEKRWSTAGDEHVCDDCKGNEEEGWVDFGAEWQSGHTRTPAHAGCRCVWTNQPKGMDDNEQESTPKALPTAGKWWQFWR